jgi:hypothetical protein
MAFFKSLDAFFVDETAAANSLRKRQKSLRRNKFKFKTDKLSKEEILSEKSANC